MSKKEHQFFVLKAHSELELCSWSALAQVMSCATAFHEHAEFLSGARVRRVSFGHRKIKEQRRQGPLASPNQLSSSGNFCFHKFVVKRTFPVWMNITVLSRLSSAEESSRGKGFNSKKKLPFSVSRSLFSVSRHGLRLFFLEKRELLWREPAANNMQQQSRPRSPLHLRRDGEQSTLE